MSANIAFPKRSIHPGQNYASSFTKASSTEASFHSSCPLVLLEQEENLGKKWLFLFSAVQYTGLNLWRLFLNSPTVTSMYPPKLRKFENTAAWRHSLIFSFIFSFQVAFTKPSVTMVITVMVRGLGWAKICRSLLVKLTKWEKGESLPGVQPLPIYFSWP